MILPLACAEAANDSDNATPANKAAAIVLVMASHMSSNLTALRSLSRCRPIGPLDGVPIKPVRLNAR